MNNIQLAAEIVKLQFQVNWLIIAIGLTNFASFFIFMNLSKYFVEKKK